MGWQQLLPGLRAWVWGLANIQGVSGATAGEMWHLVGWHRMLRAQGRVAAVGSGSAPHCHPRSDTRGYRGFPVGSLLP